MTSNTSSGFGGGIFTGSSFPDGLSGDHLTLNDVTIAANTAITAGAGILNQGDLTVNGSQLMENVAGQQGGALYSGNYAPFIYALTPTVTLSQSVVQANSATLGGGLYNVEGDLAVYASDILTNTATTAGGIYNLHRLTVDDSTIAYNQASDDGGGIFSSGQMTLTNSLVADNQTTGNSGGVYSRPTLSTGLMAASLIQNSTIRGNSAGAGGGLYLVIAAIDNSLVTGNSAQFGGGLFGFGPLTVTQSLILTNTASEDGGGFHVGSGDVIISSSTIAANTASRLGGGVDNLG